MRSILPSLLLALAIAALALFNLFLELQVQAVSHQPGIDLVETVPATVDLPDDAEPAGDPSV